MGIDDMWYILVGNDEEWGWVLVVWWCLMSVVLGLCGLVWIYYLFWG